MASWSDAASPYGYSSALFSGGSEWPIRAVRSFVEACAAHEIASVFVRLHPLLCPPADALDCVGARVTHGNTVHVDLTLSEQALRDGQRSGHRYEIRRLYSEGFRVVIDDWSLYDCFVDIYLQTMRRHAADPYYLFSTEYFRGLRDALGQHLHLIAVRAPNQTIAAAGLFFETDRIVQYHLSGTAEEYLRFAPSKLMLDQAIIWAKNAGNRVLHLGGGVGSSDDALFQFKLGFSKLKTPFQTWRIICDSAMYARAAGGAGRCSESILDFFPSYRSSALIVK